LKSAPSTLMFELIPRWPEKESCPREGIDLHRRGQGDEVLEARPLMGRLAIAVWSRVDVRTVLVVSTRAFPPPP
jgi:hypothetical protein